MKPGWKTTEFWLRAAAMVVSAALASGAVPSEGPWLQLLGGAGTLLSMFGYSDERRKLKTEAMAREAAAVRADIPPKAFQPE